MKLHCIAMLCLAAGAVGCATSGTATETRPSESQDEICTTETPAGSHVPRTICRPAEQSRRERDEARQFMSRPTSTNEVGK